MATVTAECTEGPWRHVFFRPWVGREYGSKSKWGVAVMVLGESHHCGTSADECNQNLTIELIKGVICGRERHAFWAKTRRLFCGRDSAADQSAEFWNSVIFYNYVQESVGTGPRLRPSSQKWAGGGPAFLEVVERYRPGLVLALGRKLWDELPRNEDHAGPPIMLPDRGQRETWLYPHRKGEALALGISHPTWPGWKYNDWVPCVSAALDEARRRQRPKV